MRKVTLQRRSSLSLAPLVLAALLAGSAHAVPVEWMQGTAIDGAYISYGVPFGAEAFAAGQPSSHTGGVGEVGAIASAATPSSGPSSPGGSTTAQAHAGNRTASVVVNNAGSVGMSEAYVVHAITSATDPIGTPVPVTLNWQVSASDVDGSWRQAWIYVWSPNCSGGFCSTGPDLWLDTPSYDSVPRNVMGVSKPGHIPIDTSETVAVRRWDGSLLNPRVGDQIAVSLRAHAIGSAEPLTVTSVSTQYSLSVPAGYSILPVDPAVVPEPTTALLLACGLVGLAISGNRRNSSGV